MGAIKALQEVLTATDLARQQALLQHLNWGWLSPSQFVTCRFERTRTDQRKLPD